jgi:Flp pilus assembly pilin Flp
MSLNKKLNKKGQGLVEYILLIALIALVAVVGVRSFGRKMRTMFVNIANKIAGTMDTAPTSDTGGGGAGSSSGSGNVVNSVANLTGSEEVPSGWRNTPSNLPQTQSQVQSAGSGGMLYSGASSYKQGQKNYLSDEYIDWAGYEKTFHDASEQAWNELGAFGGNLISKINVQTGNENIDKSLAPYISSFKQQGQQWLNQKVQEMKETHQKGISEGMQKLHEDVRNQEDRFNKWKDNTFNSR